MGPSRKYVVKFFAHDLDLFWGELTAVYERSYMHIQREREMKWVIFYSDKFLSVDEILPCRG